MDTSSRILENDFWEINVIIRLRILFGNKILAVSVNCFPGINMEIVTARMPCEYKENMIKSVN